VVESEEHVNDTTPRFDAGSFHQESFIGILIAGTSVIEAEVHYGSRKMKMMFK
jgi:hypothetical protein